MTEIFDALKLNIYKHEISDWWTRDSNYYDNYPEHGLTSQEESEWRRFFVQELNTDSLKILDVGTGTGSLSLLLAATGHQVTGIDISNGMLSECSKKAKTRGISLRLQVGDAEALPFKDEYFDVVTSRWVLWTLLRPDIAIREWKRVLKPGGKILAFDVISPKDNTDSISHKIKRLCSGMLISLQDGRKFVSNGYNPEIYNHLPLYHKKPDAFKKQVALFFSAGFPNVTVKRIDLLSDFSSKDLNKPWRYRLGWKGYGDWHCIISTKQV